MSYNIKDLEKKYNIYDANGKIIVTNLLECIDKTFGSSHITSEEKEYIDGLKELLVINNTTLELGGNAEIDGNVKVNEFSNIKDSDDNSVKHIYSHYITYIITINGTIPTTYSFSGSLVNDGSATYNIATITTNELARCLNYVGIKVQGYTKNIAFMLPHSIEGTSPVVYVDFSTTAEDLTNASITLSDTVYQIM